MTLFYADDDFEDQEFFALVIQDLNPEIKIVTARDGKETLQTLANSNDVFDAIFLDLNMPLMNGIECLTALRSTDRFRSMPIFLYSTTSNKNEVEKALQAGANKFLVKDNTISGMKRNLGDALGLSA